MFTVPGEKSVFARYKSGKYRVMPDNSGSNVNQKHKQDEEVI